MSLRDRNRLKKREALVEAAFELFEARGFEATTVDQIAEAAEVSRRTFFRYFSCKEEVAFPHMDERLSAFRAALHEHPGAPVQRVRHACLAMAAEFDAHRAELMRQQRLVALSPALLAFDQKQDLDWETAIAEVLEEGGGSEASRRRAQVWAGAIMGAVRASLRTWFQNEGRGRLVDLGREALDHLEIGMVEAMPQRVVGLR